KRLGDAGDHADLTGTVAIPPAGRRLAAIIRVARFEWEHLMNSFNDLRGGNHLAHLPRVAGTDVHELDEPKNEPDATEVPDHIEDVDVVFAALDHHIDLDGTQTLLLGSVDTMQHLGHREM